MTTYDFSYAEAYSFWHQWFNDHKEWVSSNLEGYTWPGTWKTFSTILAGRPCPFCQGNGFKRLIEPYPDTFCVCSLLREMDYVYDFESPYRATKTLDDIQEWNNPIGAASLTKQIKKEVSHFSHKPALWGFLYGGYGSGKTMFLSYLKTHFRGLALYLTATDLNQLVFKRTGDHTLPDFLEIVSAAPILLLDDLGKEYSSSYLYSAIYSIINTRCIRGPKNPVFLTSNMTQKQLREGGDDTMAAIGDRLSDVDLVIPMITKQASFRTRDVS